jgi:hypothetical protein
VNVNNAQFELMRRKLAQAPKDQAPAIVDQADDATGRKLGVFAGHRAGKRRKGTSVLKRPPKDVTRATIYDVRDADGNRVTTLTTLRYKREAK